MTGDKENSTALSMEFKCNYFARSSLQITTFCREIEIFC